LSAIPEHDMHNPPTPLEIETSLSSHGGRHLGQLDLRAYSHKISTRASFVTRRDPSGALLAFLAFYNDQSEAFITMVWTHPAMRGRGVAAGMLRDLLQLTFKDITLEVHESNPALKLYQRFGFRQEHPSQSDTRQLTLRRRVSAMQPYLFPHLGYFHLTRACTHFVFYDDVNFIKRGWINRNRLAGPTETLAFSIPLSKVSQNVSIRDTVLSLDTTWQRGLFRTITQSYRSAPFFEPVLDLIQRVLCSGTLSIADLAAMSIVETLKYLRVPFSFSFSSVAFPETKSASRMGRLVQITKKLHCRRYVNAPGGRALYDKDAFLADGVELAFIDSNFLPYHRGLGGFIPGLSIIDVLMWNSPDKIALEHLCSYALS